MPEYKFEWKPASNLLGIEIRLKGKKRFRRTEDILPLNEWPEFKSISAISGLAHLKQLAEEDEELAKELEDGYYLSFKALADLDETQVRGLGLPTGLPFIFRVNTQSSLASRDFRIYWTIQENNGAEIRNVHRKGAIIESEGGCYRLPSPFFELVESIDKFPKSTGNNYDEVLAELSRILSLMRDGSGKEDRNRIKEGDVLKEMRLYHACSISLDIEKTEDDDFAITAVPFSRQITDKAANTDEVIEHAERMLAKTHENKLNEELASGPVKRTYVLDERDNSYLFIDKSLRPALELVQKIQRGSREDREAFIKNPRGALRTYYLSKRQDEDLSEESIKAWDKELERIFIEDKQFSDRVYDLGLWQRPDLPWLPHEPRIVMPNDLVIQLPDGKILIIPKKDLEGTIKKLEDARGRETVTINDAEVLSTPELINVLKGFVILFPDGKKLIIPPRDLRRTIEKLKDGLRQGKETVTINGSEVKPTLERINFLKKLIKEKRPKNGPPPPSSRYVLLTKENFELIEYTRKMPKRVLNLEDNMVANELNPGLQLKNYQKEGVDWLLKSYRAGWPGVLLADDMGLGKTLQTLVFLKGLTEAGAAGPNKPILIVAPIGLLKNWEEEHGKFLTDPGLGEPTRIYSHHTRAVRKQDGPDINTKEAALSDEAMKQSNWILTSYETLRDYQISFGKVDFSCIVFDEIQRAKNPRSLICQATKVLKHEFAIGLSGTPVENSLTDLWTVIDILAPGRLGKLRTFIQNYDAENTEQLEALANCLLKPCEIGERNRPPLIYRRRKEEVLDQNFPRQIVHPIHETSTDMPGEQETAYADIILKYQNSHISMLQAIHGFRTVSLHPIRVKETDDIDKYINYSGRTIQAFNILDEVHAEGEKALLFLASRDVQQRIAAIIKQKYRIDHLPLIINGSVKGETRQRMVNQFQERTGFDVLIISPRAGGVGINLTAANHVIHLERWWNPAVEDQCTGRAYRLGQTQDVHVYLPIARHQHYGDKSHDYILHKLLDEKRNLAKNIFVPTGIDWGKYGRKMGISDNDEYTVIDIDAMEPHAFEAHVKHQIRKYSKIGEYSVNLTPPTGDAGADLIIKNSKDTIVGIVQCKHTANFRTSPRQDASAIHDLMRAREAYPNDAALLFAVTNAFFAREARQLANREDVILICRDEITRVGEKIIGILRRH